MQGNRTKISVMPQLTSEDRAFLTGHLSQSRDLLLGEIADLRPDQWIFRPDDETWSIAECADHIVTIEKRVFSMVSKHMQTAAPDPQRAAEVQKKTPWILEAVPPICSESAAARYSNMSAKPRTPCTTASLLT